MYIFTACTVPSFKLTKIEPMPESCVNIVKPEYFLQTKIPVQIAMPIALPDYKTLFNDKYL